MRKSVRSADYNRPYCNVFSLRFASVRFGSVRFGSIRFGSVRFDSVRFGSVRFDSVRFGFWSGQVGSCRVVSGWFRCLVWFDLVRFGSSVLFRSGSTSVSNVGVLRNRLCSLPGSSEGGNL